MSCRTSARRAAWARGSWALRSRIACTLRRCWASRRICSAVCAPASAIIRRASLPGAKTKRAKKSRGPSSCPSRSVAGWNLSDAGPASNSSQTRARASAATSPSDRPRRSAHWAAVTWSAPWAAGATAANTRFTCHGPSPSASSCSRCASGAPAAATAFSSASPRSCAPGSPAVASWVTITSGRQVRIARTRWASSASSPRPSWIPSHISASCALDNSSPGWRKGNCQAVRAAQAPV